MTTPDFDDFDKRAAEIQGQLMRACTDQTGAVFSCFCELSDEALVMIATALREMYQQGLTDGDKKLAAVIEKVERYKP